jgi:8-amino-7-oxononanoate synthase
MNKVKDLSDAEKRQLLKQLLARNEKKTERVLNPVRSTGSTDDPTSFNDFAGFKMLQEQAEIFQTLALRIPICKHLKLV